MIFYDYNEKDELINVQYPNTEESLNTIKQDRTNYQIIGETIEGVETKTKIKIELPKNEKLIDDFHNCIYVKSKSGPVKIADKKYLEKLKVNYKDTIKQMSFSERSKILPDYKQINASLDVYALEEKTKIKKCINDFRAEFYRLSNLIEGAESKEGLEKIIKNHKYNEITL